MQVNGLHCRYILQFPPPINETDFQDAHIIEILLKVALNTHKNQPNHNIVTTSLLYKNITYISQLIYNVNNLVYKIHYS